MDRKKTSKGFNNEINIIELSNKKPSRKRLSDVEYNKTETAKKGVNKNLFKVDNYAEFDFRANKKTAKTESVASTLAVTKNETVKSVVSPKVEKASGTKNVSTPKTAKVTTPTTKNVAEKKATATTAKKVTEKKTAATVAKVTEKKASKTGDTKKAVPETISLESALDELRHIFDLSISEVDLSLFQTEEKTTAKVEKKPAKKTSDTDSVVVNDKKATAVLKLRVDDDERPQVVALACNNTNFDESAEKVVRIARMGLLFD